MKALGDINRKKQFESYIEPMSAEKKIAITQKAHIKAQKELNKIVKRFDKAIIHYGEARFGADEAIELLGKERKNIRRLQDNIKEATFNALPYKDLDGEKIREETFFVKRKRISGKMIAYTSGVIANLVIYLTGHFQDNEAYYVLGIIVSAGIVLAAYLPRKKFILS